jgi:hypothetical protein
LLYLYQYVPVIDDSACNSFLHGSMMWTVE